MPARSRSIIGRSLAGYLVAVCIASLSRGLVQVEGRKCVCTSKACKEARVDTCRTRFFCYTELILTSGQEIGESTTTRGCTEGATPLMCETKSWESRSFNAMEPSASPRFLVPWPKLKCCNSHDYCNASDDDRNDEDDDGENAGTWTRERKLHMDRERGSMDPRETSNRDAMLTMRRSERKHEEDPARSGSDRLLGDRVKALHIAALVLAVAALISVLASCYVVTRFLKSNRYVMGTIDYS